jgi:RNA polymerase sigma-70 factor, ECF subfamily
MTTFCESPCLLANAPTICQSQLCLIRHSARGDRVATELLFERLYAAVYQQAKRICHGGDDAEDLAQDTLILAFEGLAHLQDPQRLLHWMSKIAWNRHRERLRVSKFAPPSLDEYVDSRHSSFVCKPDQPVDRLILRETAETLKRAVRALPPSLYDAFRLRVLDQLSTRETATRLSTTEMAVRTRLRRARLILRNSLNRQTDSPL